MKKLEFEPEKFKIRGCILTYASILPHLIFVKFLFRKWTSFKSTIWYHCLNESASESFYKSSNIFIKTVTGHLAYQLYVCEFLCVEVAEGTLVCTTSHPFRNISRNSFRSWIFIWEKRSKPRDSVRLSWSGWIHDSSHEVPVEYWHLFHSFQVQF